MVSESDSQPATVGLRAARGDGVLSGLLQVLRGGVLAAVLASGSAWAQVLPERPGVQPSLACDAGFRPAEGVCVAIQVPANAYSNNRSFGRGWECRWGYRRDGEACAPVIVPANGYLDASGDRWRCKRGFQAADDICVAIAVPENGFLTSSSTGPGWACERGYRAADGACVSIEVPDNAYLEDTTYGPGWRCERGFRAAEGRCDAVAPPENAHLDYSGTDWECDPPHRRQADVCIAP